MPDVVAPQDIDETPRSAELPRPHAERLAREKAQAAASAHPHALVLGADTVVAVGRRILPKAETRADAERCLHLLSGRRHHVFTALCLFTPQGRSERVSESTVIFARLTQAQLDAYLESGEWQGKAGGYAIQGLCARHIRALHGSFSGVVGLPLFETAQLLRGRGYPVP